MSFVDKAARLVGRLCFMGIVAVNASILSAGDWPMWRSDANRSASTAEQLPATLHLQWTRQYEPLKPAWPEDPRIHFDATYEPIILGSTMLISSSRNDSVTALETRTGEEKWRFYTNGPVRFAPVAADKRVYFGADDGYFYCLNADDGKLVWKFSAAPSNRKVLGNERLTSVWPMRGGPVLADGQIHFTVGVWPFEGTFLYTLDAATGKKTDGQPAKQIKTLRDVTPQGYLAATDSRLYIPCGRSVVTCLDLNSRRLVPSINYPTSGVTNTNVAVVDQWLFHGGISYDTKSSAQLSITARDPILADDVVYFGNDGDVVAYDLQNPKVVEFKDRRGRPQKRTEMSLRWRLKNKDIRAIPDLPGQQFRQWLTKHPLKVHIKAGSRLYGHQENELFAIDLPSAEGEPGVSWKTTIEGTPSSLLAADGRLYVVTREGAISCFGKEQSEPRHHVDSESLNVVANDNAAKRAAEILAQSEQRDGYALILGIQNGRLTEELVRQSNLRLIVIEDDREKVAALRRRLDAQGLYGKRVVVHAGDPLSFGLPPYLANLIVSENPHATGMHKPRAFAQTVFASLRPYGGVACLELSNSDHDDFVHTVSNSKLPNAEVKRSNSLTLLSRAGSLPGSADWTHEYGDPSNTLMSHDTLVKAPLGVLWFGGPSSSGELFYNRHYWGPSMAVIGGRMFIQGPGKMTAVDVYTGRILWQIPLGENDKINEGRRGNNFEKVLSGFHYLAVEDGIYLVDGRKGCIRFDPATGKKLSRFTLPDPESDWGRIRVKSDLLVTEVFRKVDKDYGIKTDEKMPVELIVMNRYSGEIVWSKKAEMSFPLFAISGDRVFCFDGALENLYRDSKRKGLVPKAADTRYVVALDLKSGKELWKYTTDTIATWVNYSEEHDVLMVSNRKGMTAYRGQNGKELWKKYSEGKGFRGHPENLWDKVIVWNDRIIDQRGPGAAYDIETGNPIIRRHPLTNKPIPWEFTKAGHHCNYAIASTHLLTFRAAEAGFCDIVSGNTSRLGGFRSGCRNSLIPANGVLNAPNYAHGCVCGFSLFTSLALTHLPEAEVWSYSAITLKEKDDSIERVGINFGAPGDRLAANGTLWLDYPNVGGSSPAITISTLPKSPQLFQQHSALVEGDELKWVAASGVEGDLTATIVLNPQAEQAKSYTVRLHFSEPHEKNPGERIFDVSLQGETVLDNFDVVATAGKQNRAVVKELHGIQAVKDLKIELKSTRDKALLSGVEIVAE